MALTIVSVGFPFAAVTQDSSGGSEQVLAAIDRALVARGHRSIVVAPAGSVVVGDLRAGPPLGANIEEADRVATHAAVRRAIADVVMRDRPDLVHLHGLDYAQYLPQPGLPVLVTLHLPLDWYPLEAVRPQRPRTWLQPVSADQARRAPANVTLLDPIANGVDVDAFRTIPKAEHLLMLGRVAPEKGFHDALDAARLARVPLIAAGEIFPYAAHRRYFEEQVAPRLDADRRFIGAVHGERKRALLASARAVLIPSSAPETSSLVAMEALASGTPVIAYRAGALPSIVEHGRTGFIVDDVRGMAAAIGRIDSIAPATCRAAAVARFPVRRMTDAYLGLYERLAA